MKSIRNNFRNILLFAAFSIAVVFISSCSKDDNKDTPKETIQEVTVTDLAADPIERSQEDGHVIGHLIEEQKNHYTLFRFSDSSVVPNSDSAKGKWDIGFHQTDIILNSSINGPGKVEGQVIGNSFSAVTEAPADNYETDDETGNVFSGWYSYNRTTHVISAKPDYVLVIHTHDGKYVKMEITSSYEGAPSDPSIKDQAGFYNFHYTYQPDGSRSFVPAEKQ